MKKLFMTVAVLTAFITSQAQVTVHGNKFTDNLSIGLNGTSVTPLTHHAFWKNQRGGVSLDLNKQITPVFGLTVEGSAYFNASEGAFHNLTHTSTIVDATNISLLGRLNLMNVFAGYKGTPRFFEMEAVGGFGWLHTYGDLAHTNVSANSNALSSKVGLNFNFNLCESKAWTVSFKPALIWNMNNSSADTKFRNVKYNANDASVELAAGITYHFKNSYGTHSFVVVEPKDQAEIDALNASVNSLRAQVAQDECNLNASNATIAQLQSQLDDCQKQPKVGGCSKAAVESVVTFAQGKSVVAGSQMPGVERIAKYLADNENAKVVINGYASPEGKASVNAKLAAARAEAVKNILVKKYKIAADRISTVGNGVGDLFSNPNWNRVGIVTLEDAK